MKVEKWQFGSTVFGFFSLQSYVLAHPCMPLEMTFNTNLKGWKFNPSHCWPTHPPSWQVCCNITYPSIITEKSLPTNCSKSWPTGRGQEFMLQADNIYTHTHTYSCMHTYIHTFSPVHSHNPRKIKMSRAVREKTPSPLR